jgi:hypothetical protein
LIPTAEEEEGSGWLSQYFWRYYLLVGLIVVVWLTLRRLAKEPKYGKCSGISVIHARVLHLAFFLSLSLGSRYTINREPTRLRMGQTKVASALEKLS